MRSLPPIFVAIAALSACEQRFSATPSTEGSPPPFLADAGEAWLNPAVGDAGGAAGGWASSHAMTIASCASGSPECPAPESDAAVPAAYRVVFASGRAVIRSR